MITAMVVALLCQGPGPITAKEETAKEEDFCENRTSTTRVANQKPILAANAPAAADRSPAALCAVDAEGLRPSTAATFHATAAPYFLLEEM